VLSASAAPLKVGVLSLVVFPSVGLEISGAAGAEVSTVTLIVVEIDEMLPAASVALAVIECVPSLKALLGVKLQSPEPSAAIVPSELPPSKTSTVLSASAVPLKVGVASLVIALSAGLVISGALGAVVSIVTLIAAEAVEVLLAASVALAVIECVPSLKALLGMKLQSPEPSAAVVPSEVLPSKTSTVLLASAVPLKVGVASLVVAPSAGVVISGALGVTVSTLILTAVEAVEVLLAESVAVALIECVPSLSVPLVKLQSPEPSAMVVPSEVLPPS